MKINTTSYEYLVNQYKGLVYKLAHRLKTNGVCYDDLVQAGFMGLIMASNKFDFTKGNNFMSFAAKYIVGEIKKEIRNELYYFLSEYDYRIYQKIRNDDRPINIIAKTYNLKESTIKMIKEINKPLIIEGDEILAKEIKIPLELNDEEEQIYIMRVIYHYTQQEMADKLNVSQSYVSNILKKIKSKITIK